MVSPIANHRPRDINVERAAGTVTITWADWHVGVYDLAWLRANCPCATCREERWQAAQLGERRDNGEIPLTAKPPPTAMVEGAELVGGYAIQFTWADGHNAGIYSFSALRRNCPCKECRPDGVAPIME